jgi:hypothetical protein
LEFWFENKPSGNPGSKHAFRLLSTEPRVASILEQGDQIGRLFSLGSFLKVKEAVQTFGLLSFTVKFMYE